MLPVTMDCTDLFRDKQALVKGAKVSGKEREPMEVDML